MKSDTPVSSVTLSPYFQSPGIVVYHGDCTEIADVLEPVDCVVTSPPYNQLDGLPKKGSGMWGNSNGVAGFLRAWNESGYADAMSEQAYQAWQNDIFGRLKVRNHASLFFNHQCRWRNGRMLHPVDWFRPTGWNLRQEIIWDRGGGMMMNARMFCRFDERLLWFARDCCKWNQEAVGYGTIWRVARQQQQQGKHHPVEFPLEIPRRCVTATTDPGDTVLDPFMGGGTTGAACMATGRRFIGIDINEKFCAIAAERFENASPLFREEAAELFGDQE